MHVLRCLGSTIIGNFHWREQTQRIVTIIIIRQIFIILTKGCAPCKENSQELFFLSNFLQDNIESGHNQLIRSQLIIPIVSAVILENVKTLNMNVIITLFRWFIVKRIKTLFRLRGSLFQHLENVVLMKFDVNKYV